MSAGKFTLKLTGSTTAYLQLPTHPGGVLRGARSLPLTSVMGHYEGPDIVFDFDTRGVLVGIEILCDDVDDNTPPDDALQEVEGDREPDR